ncbi:hypothetical protein [Methylobacterium gregans]|uniref:Uncharacterized protein n=1 Tax=Methylobacterium gregans TaxID=374424 RepID=A0AA37MCC1_9HYPH|nr:hypothetical protein [Methylobacterium gregans]MDQ0519408.1 hypothetical protein [Methylobacterium gregans]GJD79394.1 hypothetical protein NBEOAGPD_2620 [Methylobacterium gregans]GLS52951.1 hypothetical protein GCM10007886_11340 [Methylobacterium gregans]
MTTKATGSASPEALLKAAVSGGRAAPAEAAPAKATPAAETASPRLRLDPRLLGVAGGALVLGLICGAGLTAASLPRGGQGEALAEVHTGIDAARTESARIATEVEQLGRTFAALKESQEAARKEAAGRSAGLTERVAKAEQGLSGKIAALGDRVEQAERDQSAKLAALTTQIEKRAAAALPAPVQQAAVPVAPAKPEPTQTGSIEPKKAPEKPAVVEAWAVRDVYDGTAILEDRRRRLVEVGPGDSVPGIGRVEGIERRGREWVVVTRQGLITHQAW